MTITAKSLTARPTWQALVAHHRKIGHTHLRDLFAADDQRVQLTVG